MSVGPLELGATLQAVAEVPSSAENRIDLPAAHTVPVAALGETQGTGGKREGMDGRTERRAFNEFSEQAQVSVSDLLLRLALAAARVSASLSLPSSVGHCDTSTSCMRSCERRPRMSNTNERRPHLGGVAIRFVCCSPR